MNAAAVSQMPRSVRGNGSPTRKPSFPDPPRRRVNTHRHHTLALFLVDVLLSAMAGLLAYEVRFSLTLSEVALWLHHPTRHGEGLVSIHLGFLLLYGILFLLAAHSQDLYRHSPARTAYQESRLITRSVVIATIVLTAFIYVCGIKTVSRLFVGLTPLFSMVALITWRTIRSYMRNKQLLRGFGLQHALIVGAGKVGQLLADHLERNPHLGYKVKGFIDSNHHDDPRILGKLEQLAQVVRQEFIDEIFITIPSEREVVKTVAVEASQFSLGLRVIPELYDGLGWRTPEEFVGDFPVRVLQRRPITRPGLALKRFIDVIGSALGLIFLSPFFLLVALLIKFDSPGPVFYHAARVGRKGRRFVCYKFRTMTADADKQKTVLQHLNERIGPLFKISNDPRVTRFGAFLRKHSLDEFPQLWNVLKGDMSLVGPRPPDLEETTEYKLEHLSRLDTTPGITGLWQVSARHDPSFETAVALDNHYIQNWSLFLDFKILLQTIPVVVKGLGR